MNWYFVTCNNSKKIVPAATYLFNKYVKAFIPETELKFIDLGNEPVETWSHNVLKKLNTVDDYIVFGLDDFLIIEQINICQYIDAINLAKKLNYNRFELGWGASKKQAWIKDNHNSRFILEWHLGTLLKYGKETPYQVSCQVSIWKTSALKAILASKPMTPWEFETKTKLDRVYCHTSEQCALRYIEESAISGRQKGKINVLGLRHSDVDELVEKKLLNPNELIYGWKGNHEFKGGGEKYGKFY